MPTLNLKDQIFGYWKVLEQDIPTSKEKHLSYWICECQLCGDIHSIRGTALKNAKTTKCVKCAAKARIEDETNNEYGELKVIGPAENNNGPRAMWHCKCSCGNFIDVSGTDLRGKKVLSCGKCPTRQSNGEKSISRMLTNAGIEFLSEYSFDDFTYETGHTPRYDFYIPCRNYIIEFDGVQHFQATSGWNTPEVYQKNVERDAIKNQYCWNNNISIIRIPYNKLFDITIFDLIPETSRFLYKEKRE